MPQIYNKHIIKEFLKTSMEKSLGRTTIRGIQVKLKYENIQFNGEILEKSMKMQI